MDQLITATVRPVVKVILEGEGERWSAYVPSIPGCITTGHSQEEVRRRIEEALTVHLEDLHEVALREEAEQEASETTLDR